MWAVSGSPFSSRDESCEILGTGARRRPAASRSGSWSALSFWGLAFFCRKEGLRPARLALRWAAGGTTDASQLSSGIEDRAQLASAVETGSASPERVPACGLLVCGMVGLTGVLIRPRLGCRLGVHAGDFLPRDRAGPDSSEIGLGRSRPPPPARRGRRSGRQRQSRGHTSDRPLQPKPTSPDRHQYSRRIQLAMLSVTGGATPWPRPGLYPAYTD